MGFIMLGLKIRNGKKSDARAVCNMAAALSAHEGVADPKFTIEDYQKYGFGRRQQFKTLVAEAGEKVVAYLIFCESFHIGIGTPGLNILDLFVDNAFRRMGIGKKLFATLSSYCIRNDGTWITWQCQPKNESAIHFYRAIGGRQYAALDFELANNDLVRLSEKV